MYVVVCVYLLLIVFYHIEIDFQLSVCGYVVLCTCHMCCNTTYIDGRERGWREGEREGKKDRKGMSSDLSIQLEQHMTLLIHDHAALPY